MNSFTRALDWLKEHATALLSAAVAVLLAVFFWGRHQDEVASLKDRLTVEKGHRDIARLREKRRNHLANAMEAEQQRRRINEQVKAVQRRIVETKTSTSHLSDQAVEVEFKKRYRKWRERQQPSS